MWGVGGACPRGLCARPLPHSAGPLPTGGRRKDTAEEHMTRTCDSLQKTDRNPGQDFPKRAVSLWNKDGR